MSCETWYGVLDIDREGHGGTRYWAECRMYWWDRENDCPAYEVLARDEFVVTNLPKTGPFAALVKRIMAQLRYGKD